MPFPDRREIAGETVPFHRWLPGFLLAALVLGVYWQAGSFPFVNYDDDLFLTRNPAVRDGLTAESIRWAFTTNRDAGWIPVTWLSRLLDVSLFGMDAGKHHLVNVAIHLLNALLLFRLLRSATGKAWESWTVAALFAVHPLHVESVAWVTERKDVLAALFWILALQAWLRYLERPAATRYARVVLLFVAGLMSKPIGVTFPFVLLLLDYWPLERFRPPQGGASGRQAPFRLLLEKAPLLLLSALFSAVTYLAQDRLGALMGPEESPLWARAANAVHSYALYLLKAAWPARLAVIYPHPGTDIDWAAVGGSAALLGFLTYLALRRMRDLRWIPVGWFWFLGTMVPVIGIVQAGNKSMGDRCAYIPLIGIYIVAAWGASRLALRFRIPKGASAFAAAACLLALAARAHGQAALWRDPVVLFGHALEVTENNWVARMNMGTALSMAGRDAEALAHYREALRLNPGWAEAEYALYQTLARLGRGEEAAVHFGAALRRTEGSAVSNNNIGLSLAGAGDIEGALSYFREAIRIQPDFAEAHYNLGVALSRLGRKDEAARHFRQALRIPPVDAEAHNKLGVARMGLGRLDDAVGHFREAIGKRPDFGDARFNLAVALERSGRRAEAARELEEILRRSPGDRDAAARLARIRGDAAR